MKTRQQKNLKRTFQRFEDKDDFNKAKSFLGNKKKRGFKGEIEPRLFDKTNKNLNCVCWNIRNFSKTLWGRGATGNGVPIEDRLFQVMTALWLNSIDLCIILETGVDAQKQIADSVNKDWSGYDAVVSKPTGGYKKNKKGSQTKVTMGQETYTIIVKSDLKSAIKSVQLVGQKKETITVKKKKKTTTKEILIRQGCLIEFKYPGMRAKKGTKLVDTYYFLALHAPAPNHGKELILKVIEKANTEALKISKTNPLIFCGDLNVSDKIFNDLEDTMEGISNMVEHTGPRHDGSPVPTSLKIYGNVLRDQESESQPYDQVWLFNPPYQKTTTETIPACGVFTPQINFHNSDDLMVNQIINILDSREQKLKKFEPNAEHLKFDDLEMEVWFAHDDLKKRIDKLTEQRKSKSYKLVKDRFKGLEKVMIKLLPILQQVEKDVADAYLRGIRQLDEDELQLLLVSMKGQRTVKKYDLKAVPSLENTSLIFGGLMKTWLEGGSNGITKILDKNVFALFMSDHLPVIFRLNFFEK